MYILDLNLEVLFVCFRNTAS